MKSFSAISIKSKVALIVLLGVGTTMLVALINFISYDRITIKQSIQEEMQVLADITAARSSAALAFLDTRALENNLGHLNIRNNIVAACIYDEKGKLFASYQRQSETPVQSRLFVSKRSHDEAIRACWPHYIDNVNYTKVQSIFADQDIKNASRVLGKVVVISDLSPLHNKYSTWVALAALMLALTTVVVILMMHYLQRFVIDPLVGLTTVMTKVKEGNDLSLRADSKSQDEIGRLISTFNDMLSLIENGNTDLEIVYNELINRSTEAEAAAIELEARNEEVKEYLSGAAHDLRQPLQAMAIFIDMLEMIIQEKKQTELMEKLKASMENLQSMFSEILDVSRLEHKKGTAEVQRVNLDKLIGKLQMEFGVLARSQGLNLRVRVTDVVLETVPGILERVIRNLVSNAIRYTEQGGVLISVRKRKKYIWIEVWDTGIGISEKNIDKAFKKFENLEEANAKRGSYGLGLAIVNNFIRILGYRLDVFSKVDRGSCFRVVVPLTLSSDDHQDLLLPNESAPSSKQHIAESEDYDDVMSLMLKTNVILVDDDDEVRGALKMAMESWEINVIDFDSLEAVTDYFSGGDFIDPDLIVSDYQLSETVTGEDIISDIRLMCGVNVPAFIVTGTRDSDLLARIEAFGCEYLPKPVDLKRFKKMVFEYCE